MFGCCTQITFWDYDNSIFDKSYIGVLSGVSLIGVFGYIYLLMRSNITNSDSFNSTCELMKKRRYNMILKINL